MEAYITAIAPREIKSFILKVPDKYLWTRGTIKLRRGCKNVQAEGEILRYLRVKMSNIPINKGEDVSFACSC